MDRYLLRQTFRYDYESPVRRLRHRLMIVPRTVHGGQRLVDHDMVVRGCRGLLGSRLDSFGNPVFEFRARAVEAWIEFQSWSLVGQDGPPGEATLPPAEVGDPRLLTPTRLTSADDVIAAVGRGLPRQRMAAAEAACRWAHRSLAYEFGVTGVRTTAAEAVAGGRGVCQDYAHVMLAVCRAAGLPARYVSGHLLGEGGSHAWVEVMVEDGARWVVIAFDPTHDRRAVDGYVTVAVGRDYVDVAPTSGTFSGTTPGVLAATKSLTPVEANTPVPA